MTTMTKATVHFKMREKGKYTAFADGKPVATVESVEVPSRLYPGKTHRNGWHAVMLNDEGAPRFMRDTKGRMTISYDDARLFTLKSAKKWVRENIY